MVGGGSSARVHIHQFEDHRILGTEQPGAVERMASLRERFVDAWNADELAALHQLLLPKHRKTLSAEVLAEELACRRETLGSLVEMEQGFAFSRQGDDGNDLGKLVVRGRFERERGFIILRVGRLDGEWLMATPEILADSELGAVAHQLASGVIEALIADWNARAWPSLYERYPPLLKSIESPDQFTAQVVDLYAYIGTVHRPETTHVARSATRVPRVMAIGFENEHAEAARWGLSAGLRRCGDRWQTEGFQFHEIETIEALQVDLTARESLVKVHGFSPDLIVKCDEAGRRVIPGRVVSCEASTSSAAGTLRFRWEDFERGLTWLESDVEP
jgi:hypothetical protein